ncbi:MAG: ABC transporter ATP-binding protein [Lysobacterales bacterium]
MSNPPLIQLEQACKRYLPKAGDPAVEALAPTDLRIEAGEFVAVTGPSGGGKSTLLNLLGCLAPLSAGRYLLGGRCVGGLAEQARADVRNRRIGFVFQGFQLLPQLSALENVALPLLYQSLPQQARLQRARQLLERLGLGERLQHRPDALSGGQRQRVAIARALVCAPELILADEPTGSLDPESSLEVMNVLRELHAHGSTLVLVTHDPAIAASAPRRLRIERGRIEQDQKQSRVPWAEAA